MGTVFLLLHFQSELSSRSKSSMKLILLLTASASMVLADPHGSYAYTHIERPSYTLIQSWGGPSHFAQKYSGNRARSFSRFNSITYGARTGSLNAANFPADTDEPTARASLNFINAIGGSDLCGQASRAYIEAVIGGKSGQQAAAAARQAYIGGYSQGLRNTEDTPCAAAEASFRKTYGSDKNSVLEAALAYMNAAPSTTCGEAGKAYVAAITTGESSARAGLFAARAFIDAADGGFTPDAACTAALQGFSKTAGKASANLNSAFESFVSSASAGVDPVCTAAAGAYIDAKIAKKTDEGALGAAAKAYIAALSANPGAGSACAKAASAFTGKANPFKSSPAPAPFRISADPTAAAASNFLNAVGGTDICAKASKAYVEAVSAGKSAVQATNAAKQAYISAYNSGTRNAQGTPCAAAEVNFKSNFGSDKNVVLEAAKAYINAAEPTTCGEAGKAYVSAVSSGSTPEKAALLAAKAFITNVDLGSADSAACTSASKGFLGATSGSNNVLTAMEAFINSGESGVDPVCIAAAEAYIDAKIANNSDEDALSSAATAYIAAINANPGAGAGCLNAASQFIGN